MREPHRSPVIFRLSFTVWCRWCSLWHFPLVGHPLPHWASKRAMVRVRQRRFTSWAMVASSSIIFHAVLKKTWVYYKRKQYFGHFRTNCFPGTLAVENMVRLPGINGHRSTVPKIYPSHQGRLRKQTSQRKSHEFTPNQRMPYLHDPSCSAMLWSRNLSVAERVVGQSYADPTTLRFLIKRY